MTTADKHETQWCTHPVWAALQWYAIRPIYNRDRALQCAMQEAGIEYVVPCKIKEAINEAKQMNAAKGFSHTIYDRILVSNAIEKIYFFCAPEADIKDIRDALYHDGIIYTDATVEHWKPLQIPGAQVNNFLKTISIDDKYTIYNDRPNLFAKKEKVRIVGDPRYGGLTGVIQRIADSKRLIVRIEGFNHIVATEYIPNAFVRKLTDDSDMPVEPPSLPSMKIAELAYYLRILPFAIGHKQTTATQLAVMLHTFLTARRLCNYSDEHFYALRIGISNEAFNRHIDNILSELPHRAATPTDRLLALCYSEECRPLLTPTEAERMAQIQAELGCGISHEAEPSIAEHLYDIIINKKPAREALIDAWLSAKRSEGWHNLKAETDHATLFLLLRHRLITNEPVQQSDVPLSPILKAHRICEDVQLTE